jgi:hypothetical protein
MWRNALCILSIDDRRLLFRERILKHSFIGRLLEEISWQGAQIKGYRGGGVGFENVLTIEIFQALDFLPPLSFLAR